MDEGANQVPTYLEKKLVITPTFCPIDGSCILFESVSVQEQKLSMLQC